MTKSEFFALCDRKRRPNLMGGNGSRFRIEVDPGYKFGRQIREYWVRLYLGYGFPNGYPILYTTKDLSKAEAAKEKFEKWTAQWKEKNNV